MVTYGAAVHHSCPLEWYAAALLVSASPALPQEKSPAPVMGTDWQITSPAKLQPRRAMSSHFPTKDHAMVNLEAPRDHGGVGVPTPQGPLPIIPLPR